MVLSLVGVVAAEEVVLELKGRRRRPSRPFECIWTLIFMCWTLLLLLLVMVTHSIAAIYECIEMINDGERPDREEVGF